MAGMRLIESLFDGGAFAVREEGGFVALEPCDGGWSPGATYAQAPWTLGAARFGDIVLHASDGWRLTLFRLDGPPRVFPSGPVPRPA